LWPANPIILIGSLIIACDLKTCCSNNIKDVKVPFGRPMLHSILHLDPHDNLLLNGLNKLQLDFENQVG
jgi:hypothetical protein